MELILSIISWSTVPLVSVAFVLLVYLVADEIGFIPRGLLASALATLVYVGPALANNAIKGIESEANPIIYIGLFFFPSMLVALLVSWWLKRKLLPALDQVFE